MKNTKICSRGNVSSSFRKGIVFGFDDKPVYITLEHENRRDPKNLLVYLNTENKWLEVKMYDGIDKRPLTSEERSCVIEELLMVLSTFRDTRFNWAVKYEAEYYTLIDLTYREHVTDADLLQETASKSYKSILEEFLEKNYGDNSSYSILRNTQGAFNEIVRNAKKAPEYFYADIDKDLSNIERKTILYFANCVLYLKGMDSKYKARLSDFYSRIEFIKED